MITFTTMVRTASELYEAVGFLEEHSEGAPSHPEAMSCYKTCHNEFWNTLCDYRDQHGCESYSPDCKLLDILQAAQDVVNAHDEDPNLDAYLHELFVSETPTPAEEAEVEAYEMHKGIIKAEVHAKAVEIWKEAQMAWCFHLYNEGHHNLSFLSHSILDEGK